jgi:hypothetical protein
MTSALRRLASLAAVLAALTALLISPPFAAAYFRAYPGYGAPPFWWSDFLRTFPDLLQFAAPPSVYQFYGRIYSLAIPLSLPAVLELRKRIPTVSRSMIWARRIFTGGLALFGLGVIGDYWPDQESFWIGLGFSFELLGSLMLWIGAFMYGIGANRSESALRGTGSGLIGIAPLGLLGILLLAHIPSGPLLGYFILMLLWGAGLILDRDQAARLQEAPVRLDVSR